MVGGVLNVGTAWVLNRGRGGFAPALTPDAFRALPTVRPLDAAWLLAGRTNPDRARVLEIVIAARGWALTRAPYRTLEGAGTNLLVDFGPGPRTLILAAHHAVFLTGGAEKAAAVAAVLNEPYDPLRWPAQVVTHHGRHVVCFLDHAAAGVAQAGARRC